MQNSRYGLLLAGLTPKALAELQSVWREEQFSEGAKLWNAGDRIGHVIFPASGTVSIRVPTKDGFGIEVAGIGPEGAVGFHDEEGLPPAATQAAVQIPGRFITIPTQAFHAAVHRNEEIRQMAAVCNSWLLLQAQQIAACNAVHSADARFCRWLARASDVLSSEVIPVTQEAIAQALGIRRTTATLIAQQLQVKGAISYSRGRIVIRDRAALRAGACDCCHALGRAHWPSELLRNGDAAS
jgi:CRP-like cAMP-binding protein